MNLVRVIIHFFMGLLPKSVQKRMLSCEDAAVFVSNQAELSGVFKYRVKMHIFLCQCCSNLDDQFDFIDEKCKNMKSVSLTNEQMNKVNNLKSQTIEKFTKKS